MSWPTGWCRRAPSSAAAVALSPSRHSCRWRRWRERDREQVELQVEVEVDMKVMRWRR
jgi:hypothetical protein